MCIFDENNYGGIFMTKYLNLGGNSNIESYEIGSDSITVRFKGTPRLYRYSYAKAGKMHVDNMIRLAKAGQGLNSYIMNYVKKLYD